MNDILMRIMNISERIQNMDVMSGTLTIVLGVLAFFGFINCVLGFRLLRFWMMLFGFVMGAGLGFGIAYTSGTQDKMVYGGAMLGLGIVLAVVSFAIYKAGIFILGAGLGLALSIYVIHPTSSLSFFICILLGVGLGMLAIRWAKEVIIVGTSLLGGILTGLSAARLGGLEDIPYGIGMSVGFAILGMLIQFATNRSHDEDEDEEEQIPHTPFEKIAEEEYAEELPEMEDIDFDLSYDLDEESYDNDLREKSSRSVKTRKSANPRKHANPRKNESYQLRR